MPRKSNNSSKTSKKSGKKRSLWSRAYNARFSMKDVARELWRLKGLVNSEMLKKDVVFAPGTIVQGSIVSIAAIAQGDTDSARTGNSIFCRSYNLNGSITHNTTGQNNQVVRVSVVQDNQQIGDTSPTYTDIYESSSPYAHLNSDTVGRFKVLWSRTYTVNNYDKNNAMVKINVPMRHHVRYNGTTANDIQKGGLFLCLSCDEVGAAGLFPSFQGESRLSYHDN